MPNKPSALEHACCTVSSPKAEWVGPISHQPLLAAEPPPDPAKRGGVIIDFSRFFSVDSLWDGQDQSPPAHVAGGSPDRPSDAPVEDDGQKEDIVLKAGTTFCLLVVGAVSGFALRSFLGSIVHWLAPLFRGAGQ
jgi:hypothetical protein